MTEHSKTVLIIEDEEGIRDILQQVMELNGYQVFTATNGKEGLEQLRHISRPDLIL
ncbi:MAG: response regulator, partial [Bdellovibrionia bacterium]